MMFLKVLENKEERWILFDRIATLANLNDNHLPQKISCQTLHVLVCAVPFSVVLLAGIASLSVFLQGQTCHV